MFLPDMYKDVCSQRWNGNYRLVPLPDRMLWKDGLGVADFQYSM